MIDNLPGQLVYILNDTVSFFEMVLEKTMCAMF